MAYNFISFQDYVLMLFHHMVTVLLLGMAFVVNGVQIGTLILLAHDISDVPLEASSLSLRTPSITAHFAVSEDIQVPQV